MRLLLVLVLIAAAVWAGLAYRNWSQEAATREMVEDRLTPDTVIIQMPNPFDG